MKTEKMAQLAGLARNAGVEGVVLGPSADLAYLTGLAPLGDERFKALFLLADGRFFYISPELYYEETRMALGEQADIFKWSDTEGFAAAIARAGEKYRLAGAFAVNDGVRAVDAIDLSVLTGMKLRNGVPLTEALRVVKTPAEQEALRRAARIADRVADEMPAHIRPGMTEGEIREKLESLLFAYGAQGLAFETIVASGPNSSRPHYCGGGRVIAENDVMVLDFGCRVEGFCSDISRTVFVGEPTAKMKEVYAVVLAANEAGEAAAKAGVSAQTVDRAARAVIGKAGYGEYFINRTGHGIGWADHEPPFIKEGNAQILADGMAFSVEPGVYLPGEFGMRVEDIVLLSGGRAEVLNRADKSLRIAGE